MIFRLTWEMNKKKTKKKSRVSLIKNDFCDYEHN